MYCLAGIKRGLAEGWGGTLKTACPAQDKKSGPFLKPMGRLRTPKSGDTQPQGSVKVGISDTAPHPGAQEVAYKQASVGG